MISIGEWSGVDLKKKFEEGLWGRWEKIKYGVGDWLMKNELGNNLEGLDGDELR